MNYIIIEPQTLETINDHHIRSCTIKRFDNDLLVDKKMLWFKFSVQVPPPDYDDCDSYLLALILDAMAEKKDIIVKGSISAELLSNLVEYQSVWHKWLPDTYAIITISVERIRKNEIPVHGAVSAFSGGVDGTFSVWQHSQSKNSYRSKKINFCTFVHGFDIPLSENEAFTLALKSATAVLQDIGIQLLPLQTNYRSVSSLSWEHTFGSALVAALNNFKNISGTCIIGSSHDYNHLFFPWGSTPISDHLLSSDNFKVLHDGSSHSRTEKITELCEWQMGIDHLHVCWEGENDKNCGNCEKCLRTQANFLTIGQPLPKCFPDTEHTKSKLSRLNIPDKNSIISEWEDILHHASRHRIQDPWVEHVKSIIESKKNANLILPKQHLDLTDLIKQNTLFKTLLPIGSRRKSLINFLLQKVLFIHAK